ncbi:MAG: DUF5050 domain-containing protein [Lachnospiraceae bacterium]|nr:DUF5050 domain-containing protein [Lachnospiraceae bacterium]
MKIRFRGLFVALIVTLGLLLSSCKNEEVEVADVVIDSMNLQMLPPGDLVDAGDEILFIRYPECQLYCLKKGSFVAEPFCKDPTCFHVTEKCAALGACSNLENYKGTIYAIDSSNQLLMLKDDHFVKVDGIKGGFTHTGGKLYVCESGSNATLAYSENGKLERVITEEVLGYWRYQIGHYLYGNNGGAMNRIDLNNKDAEMEFLFEGWGFTDGSCLYQIDFKDYFLYRRDLDGNNPVKLLDDPIPNMNFDRENLYFRYYIDQNATGEKCGEVYRMKKDGTENPVLITTFPEPVRCIYTISDKDWIYVMTTEGYWQNARETLYAVRIDGSETREITYSDD